MGVFHQYLFNKSLSSLSFVNRPSFIQLSQYLGTKQQDDKCFLLSRGRFNIHSYLIYKYTKHLNLLENIKGTAQSGQIQHLFLILTYHPLNRACQPMAYRSNGPIRFCTACQLRMIFLVVNGWRKEKQGG